MLRQTIMEDGGGGTEDKAQEAIMEDGGGAAGDKAQSGEVGKVEKTGRRTGLPWKPIQSVDGAQDGAHAGGVGKEEKTCLTGVVTAHTGNFEGDRDGVIQALRSATGDKVPLSSGICLPGITP